ncbi:hypothetical protein H4R24_004605 [Coemansia sp. RSA 988]|nr:hypothetical protein H4R24_004605 [Coemansia sp. RSA 988]
MESVNSLSNADMPPPIKRQRTNPSMTDHEGDTVMGEHIAPPLISEVTAIQDVPKWQETTEASFNGIVAVRFTQPIAFDTDPAWNMVATGFIVDAQRGIILTNRHVVGGGPFVGEAVMHDHEVVEVQTIYRDPIHDFGFLRFDPSKIKYMKLVEIPLAPEHARVGIDVRIIGNDAGEKLSILAGSISRIDRNVPSYGYMTYNDLNSFYLQSASFLSGGSSGSPVIDIEGRAVGLQAGGRTHEATNYFFPLDRVKRALELIQQGYPVLRGSIQTRFIYNAFDVAQKLGLPEEIEAMVRRMRPDDIGMLVVATVLPEGPGAKSGLEEGDILLKINGEVITHFVALEDLLDNNIGKYIDVTVIRGGETIEANVAVQDMHALTPSRLVTFGGCVVHDLSYQLAYSYTLPLRGAFMTSTGKFMPFYDDNDGVIVDSIDDKPVNNLDDFIAVLRTIPDHEPLPIVTYSISDVHTKRGEVVRLSHQWNTIRMYTRNDSTGLWDCQKINMCPRPVNISPVNVRFPTLSDPRAGKAAELAKTIVTVFCVLPVPIEGISKEYLTDYGFIADVARGLVVVSRRTIPLNICDLYIVLAGLLMVPAKLRFLHPTHNFAIIQYDPKRVGDNNVYQATLSSRLPKQGDAAHMVTFNSLGNPMCLNTVVSDMAEILIAARFPPRWRCINTETVHFESKLAGDFRFGLVGDENGHVQTIWMPFMRSHKVTAAAGLPTRAILPVLEALQQGQTPSMRRLNIEVKPVSLTNARACGLSLSRLDEIQQANPDRCVLFRIEGVELLSKAHEVLRPLDIIISINGKLMQRIDDLDQQYTNKSLTLVILRDKQEKTVVVETTEYDGGTRKLVFWCGAVFQAPYTALLLQSSKVPSGVYCSNVATGSPAQQYELAPTYWITNVNGISTPDLESFERVVRACPDNTYVRVKTISYDNEPCVLSIRTCYHYWPTSTLSKDSAFESNWHSSESD